MEHSVELCGVHTPRDELAFLRRELQRLGVCDSGRPSLNMESTPSHSTATLMVEADPRVRVDGERIATRLELEHEEAALEFALVHHAQREAFQKAIQHISSQERDGRELIVSEWEACVSDAGRSAEVQRSRVLERAARDAVTASQRKTALELLQHNRMIEELDRDQIDMERQWHAAVAPELEAARRDAELSERHRMTAEKRVILPEEELNPKRLPPYLLNSFERFLPPLHGRVH